MNIILFNTVAGRGALGALGHPICELLSIYKTFLLTVLILLKYKTNFIGIYDTNKSVFAVCQNIAESGITYL